MSVELIVDGQASVAGTVVVPGDKSISHRALMFAATAEGESRITGLAPGLDVASTAAAMESLGVLVQRSSADVTVRASGIGGWRSPPGPIDCGNSGTTIRILAGLLARRAEQVTLDGDDSLRLRPMDRVARPLSELGARVECRDGRYPPITVSGGSLHGGEVATGVASAQVKSAVLLAGLGANDRVTVLEPAPTRDHTERMLAALGVPVTTAPAASGGVQVSVEPSALPAFSLEVPGDPSSAAVLVAAALLCGHVHIEGVALNPGRIGFLETVRRMGGRVQWEATGERLGEPVGTIEAERSELSGTAVEGPMVPQVIDELPLVAVLAACASGPTRVAGAAELRVKECDRIAAMTAGLTSMGARIAERPDGFDIEGPCELRGATVDGRGDHRVVMALAVAALAASGPSRITGAEAAAVSWPDFAGVLAALGADVRKVGP